MLRVEERHKGLEAAGLWLGSALMDSKDKAGLGGADHDSIRADNDIISADHDVISAEHDVTLLLPFAIMLQRQGLACLFEATI